MQLQIVCLVLAWLIGNHDMLFQQPNDIVIEQRIFLLELLSNGAIIYLKDKEIDSGNIDENNVTAIIEEIQTLNVDDVIGLVINNSAIQEEHLLLLSQLKNLHDLSFINCEIDDQKAKLLSEFEVLHELTLCEEEITGECFATFAKMKSLKIINLVNNPNIECAYWKDIFTSQIPWIYIAECPLTDEVLISLPRNKSLRTIGLVAINGITDAVVHFFNRCPNLIDINISENPQISGRIFEQLRYPQYIESLALNDLDITDEHIKNITRFRNLRVIFLNNTKITNKSAQILFEKWNLFVCETVNTNITENGKTLMELRFAFDSKEELEGYYDRIGVKKPASLLKNEESNSQTDQN